jgi:putative restriction endonuclease
VRLPGEGFLDYVDRFRHLRVNINSATGEPSPHKPAMLLAVMDLVAAQEEPENRIRFDEALLGRFAEYFELVASSHDRGHPHYPFFHLRSGGFWHLIPREGREAAIEAMSTVRGRSTIEENVEHVRLDDQLFRAILDPGRRAELRAALIQEYFPSLADRLWSHIESEERVGRYQKELERATRQPPDKARERPPPYSRPERDKAFSRVVVQAYDSRCAACGLRLIVDGRTVVEACHLIPWSESKDDDPRNGMALCRNHHWALDRALIAPDPDLTWRISSVLDERIHGQHELLKLQGAGVIRPSKPRYWPRADALAYRVERLAC